jgi:6-pyruvoyl-tetrahydropterin synthase related domain
MPVKARSWYSAPGAWFSLLAIGATALTVEIPFLHFGFPSGHDVEFHLYPWLEVLGQWKQGILYPRWASLASFGYGEPRFVFYPPASWTLGAALSAIFPWTLASCAYIWVALAAAGLSMHALGRRWLNRRDALFAACLYAANPYHLLIVYWRSAFAELLASCLLPLLVLVVLKTAEKKSKYSIVAISLVLASAWLTNEPAAVMIHYSLALLVVVLAWRHRSPRLLLIAGIAVAAGAGLAAFYLLPAVYEQRWVQIAQAVSQGSRPQDNFLFAHTSDPDHDAFNRMVSWIAVAEMFVTIATLWAAKLWRESRGDFWWVLAGWGVVSGALMFSPTNFLWMHLPKLQFMQFPWRWMLCLSMVFALAVTIALPRWWARLAVYAALVLVLGVGWARVQEPWWDTSADMREMQDNILTSAGYEGTDEYAPASVDLAAIDKVIDKETRRVTLDGPGHAAIRVLTWSAESKSFAVEMSEATNVAVHLFNYPAWQVEVNGSAAQAETRQGSGQMLIPLAAGSNRVQITFMRTWDRKVGMWISFATALAMLLWIYFERKRSRT